MKFKNKKTGKMEDIRLPKAFKTKWINALRSGDFVQATEALVEGEGDNAKYCCLGVACKIQHPTKTLQDKGTIVKNSIIGIQRINVPKILKGDYGNNDVVHKLVDLNDSRGYSFKRIATWIDKNL